MEDIPITNAEHPHLPIADRRDLEIGRVLRQFGLLESAVATLTWGRNGRGSPGWPQVTQRLTLGRLLDLLRGLAAARFVPEFAARLIDWVDRVDRVARRRNSVVHSPWVASADQDDAPADEVVFKKFSMKLMRNRIGTITLKEIGSLRDESLQLTVEGPDLWFEIADAIDLGPSAESGGVVRGCEKPPEPEGSRASRTARWLGDSLPVRSAPVEGVFWHAAWVSPPHGCRRCGSRTAPVPGAFRWATHVEGSTLVPSRSLGQAASAGPKTGSTPPDQ